MAQMCMKYPWPFLCVLQQQIIELQLRACLSKTGLPCSYSEHKCLFHFFLHGLSDVVETARECLTLAVKTGLVSRLHTLCT